MWGAGIRKLIRHEVVLHLLGGTSIRGILVESYRDGFVLERAVWETNAGPEPLGGRQYVPRERVNYAQVDPPERSAVKES